MSNSRALWFPRSRNRGRNRGIGRLKRNLLFNGEFDIISLKCCSHVKEEHLSGENCMRGTKSGWHNKSPPLPRQNNASMAKRLPAAPSAKKLRNSTFTPQYRAEQFPNNLYVSVNCCFAKKQTWEIIKRCNVSELATCPIHIIGI